jgi:DNA-binding transcriptional ArsR family regulator
MSKSKIFDQKTIDLANYPSRRKILSSLKMEKVPLTEDLLTKKLRTTESELTFDLSKLQGAGLVKVEGKEGSHSRKISLTEQGKKMLMVLDEQEPESSEVH